jgi:hypothetical protein
MGGRSVTCSIMLLFAAAGACSNAESDAGSGDAAADASTAGADLPTVEHIAPSPRGLPADRPSIRTNNQGEFVSVPSEPKASFRVLGNTPMANGNIDVVTRRDDRDGTSYSRREIDCGSMTFRDLGAGATVIAALEDGPDQGEMSALVEGTVPADIARHACSSDGTR